MVYTNITPSSKSLTGADLTGSDGTANRTYTIPETDILTDTIRIIIGGASLHEGAGLDFTVSSKTITFLNIVDNTDVISIYYWVILPSATTSSVLTSTSLKYATPEQLAEALGILAKIPSRAVSVAPVKETVGTGDGVESIFYLDHENVISDSCTLYYGATEAAATNTLTVTTHYTIDNDSGKITLTAAGITLLSTNKIYAEYKYITNGMSDSHLISVLSRAEALVDNQLNTTFRDGTATNPAYPSAVEIQPSEGYYAQRIIVRKKPLIDLASELDGNITAIVDTLTLQSSVLGGSYFPSSGYILIGSEVIYYSGVSGNDLTGLARGRLGSTAAAHTDGDAVHTTILQCSNTEEGTNVSWTTQSWDADMYADESGLIYRFKDADPSFLNALGVANRIRIIYLYGNDTIPADITRLTLLFAKRALMTDIISKAVVAGRNEFKPELIDADEKEIQRIINSRIILSMGNT